MEYLLPCQWLQEGMGFPVLHPAVYNYIWSGKYVGCSIPDDSIMQTEIRQLVGKARRVHASDVTIVTICLKTKVRHCEGDVAL